RPHSAGATRTTRVADHDSVLTALSDVAALMFPGVYDTEPMPWGWPSLHAIRSVYADENSDPAYARAVEAIRGDPALAPLLPSAEEPGIFIKADTGFGWRLQADLHAPGAFVQSAARQVLAKGLATDSIAPLLEQLQVVVVRVGRLMAGETDEAQ